MSIQTTRRGFLKTTAAGSAVLLIGLTPKGALASGTEGAALNPFVKIGSDGHVTAIIKHFEMGQGSTTGLATLIAEELGVTMEQIGFEYAPSNPSIYNNLFFGPAQGTGGSTSMANSFQQYRQAGAAAREMLKEAAAQKWGVEARSLDIVDGMITNGADSASIGDFVEAAMGLAVPENPKMRPSNEWKLIGNPAIGRVDNFDKINGQGKFAMDVQLENQMVVVLARTPRLGGLVKSVDESAAKEIKGFINAAPLPNSVAVAVFAENTWAAFQARDALEIEWDFSNAETRSSEDLKAEIFAALDRDPGYAVMGDHVVTNAALESADQIIEGQFFFPLLAHAPMEPETCTIEPTADGGVILHDGAQFPTFGHGALAQILELPMDKVQVNTLYAGGSFGRRANSVADYNTECALAFALTDRIRPVKLVWSREDDIRGGFYRPAFGHKVRVGIDADGTILGWDHRIAGQSIMKGTIMELMAVKDGVDNSSVEGVADTAYSIPAMSTGLTDIPKATNVLWWRSVGHTHTAYVMEMMIDMVAEAAGKDPLEFRLSLLSEENEKQARMAAVLKLVAEKSGWADGAPEGRSRGIAVHHSFESYVAEVIEISGGGEAPVKIENIWCAVDCGIPVNPNMIEAQMQGGIGYGLGAIMRNHITLTEGETDQSNFPDYEPLRIGDIGSIEVHILPSVEAPTGVGEPGVPPAGPALANAIARAGGPRVFELPMAEAGIEFA